MLLTRNDRVRLLALSYLDSLPAGGTTNWSPSVRSSDHPDPVVSSVIARNEHGSHADYEKAYVALTAPYKAAVALTYHQGQPKTETSEKGIQRIAAMMPRYVRVPREVMDNAAVLLSRIASVPR